MRKTTFCSRIAGGLMAAVMAFVAAVPAIATQTVDVGYVSVKQDPLYFYTGFTANEDGVMYAAAQFPPEMMSIYAGGRIVGLRIGWTDFTQSGEAEAFVRTDLQGQNVVSKPCTLKWGTDGWNVVMFDTPYEIPMNPENTIIGCKINGKAGSYNIATTTLGNKPANSCLITSDYYRHDDGYYEWRDLSQSFDALMLIAIVEIAEPVTDCASIANIYAPEIFKQGSVGSGQFRIQNRGTNKINSIELTYSVGDNSVTHNLPLSSGIEPGLSADVNVPVYALATGETNVSISKVNGNPNNYDDAHTLPIVAVPEDVASKYTRRPLLEYFGSEGEHHNISYYDDYFLGAYAGYEDKMSIVCHHANDQFMTRDDEDSQMLLDFADGDKTQVYIPTMTLDRSVQAANALTASKLRTVAYGVLYPTPTSVAVYDEALSVPTFANLSVTNSYNPETAEVTIDVTGYVEPKVLPLGETLKLTVYLLEDNVKSNSPNWATEAEEQKYGGVYYHQNVIRQQPVPIWGVELDGDGPFSRQFVTEIDPTEWKPADMHVVALLHRSEENTRYSRQVINCAETAFDMTSIREISVDGKNTGKRIYNLSGAEVKGGKLPAGVYIVTDGTETSKVLVK